MSLLREMANEGNLKPFVPGIDERRNLNGRPKGVRSAKTILKDILTAEIRLDNPITGKSKTIIPEEEIWQTAVVQAMSGDKDARRDIYDRLEGKPINRNENTDIPPTPEQKIHQLEKEIQDLLDNDDNENGESESLVSISPNAEPQ